MEGLSACSMQCSWQCLACLMCCGCLMMTAHMFFHGAQLHAGPLDSHAPTPDFDQPIRERKKMTVVQTKSNQAKLPAVGKRGGVASSPSGLRNNTNARAGSNLGPSSDDELLAYARARRGRYLKDFEKAVADGWANELMRDPYPPPDLNALSASHEEEPSENDVETESAWDWMFGQKKEQASEQRKRAHKEEKHKKQVKEGKGDVKCEFQEGLDYLGQDLGGGFEGLSDQACCELCARRQTCVVAVMSSSHDEPPNACWLKTKITKPVHKKGVVACWSAHNKENFDAHTKAALKDGM